VLAPRRDQGTVCPTASLTNSQQVKSVVAERWLTFVLGPLAEVDNLSNADRPFQFRPAQDGCEPPRREHVHSLVPCRGYWLRGFNLDACDARLALADRVK